MKKLLFFLGILFFVGLITSSDLIYPIDTGTDVVCVVEADEGFVSADEVETLEAPPVFILQKTSKAACICCHATGNGLAMRQSNSITDVGDIDEPFNWGDSAPMLFYTSTSDAKLLIDPILLDALEKNSHDTPIGYKHRHCRIEPPGDEMIIYEAGIAGFFKDIPESIIWTAVVLLLAWLISKLNKDKTVKILDSAIEVSAKTEMASANLQNTLETLQMKEAAKIVDEFDDVPREFKELAVAIKDLAINSKLTVSGAKQILEEAKDVGEEAIEAIRAIKPKQEETAEE